MICWHLGVPLSKVQTQAVKWQVANINAGDKQENQYPLKTMYVEAKITILGPGR